MTRCRRRLSPAGRGGLPLPQTPGARPAGIPPPRFGVAPPHWTRIPRHSPAVTSGQCQSILPAPTTRTVPDPAPREGRRVLCCGELSGGFDPRVGRVTTRHAARPDGGLRVANPPYEGVEGEGEGRGGFVIPENPTGFIRDPVSQIAPSLCWVPDICWRKFRDDKVNAFALGDDTKRGSACTKKADAGAGLSETDVRGFA